MDTCHFSQYNGEYNVNKRILDLLSNSPLSIVSCHDPLIPEDGHHKWLNIVTEFTEIHTILQQPQVNFLYLVGDYQSISSFLNNIK